MAVLVDPAANLRPEYPRQIIQVLVAATLKGPTPNCFSELLQTRTIQQNAKRSMLLKAGVWPICGLSWYKDPRL